MRKFSLRWLIVTALASAVACGGSDPSEPNDYASVSEALSGTLAKGTIPAGMPARLGVGLFEGPGGTWMKTSGAAWDYRYQYFTKG